MTEPNFIEDADFETNIGFGPSTVNFLVRLDPKQLKDAGEVVKQLVEDWDENFLLNQIEDEEKLRSKLDDKGIDLVIHAVSRCVKPDSDELDLLLQHSILTLSLQDSKGNCALHYLAWNGVDLLGRVPIRRLLIRNLKGATPLHLQAKKNVGRDRILALPTEILEIKTKRGATIKDALLSTPHEPVLQEVAQARVAQEADRPMDLETFELFIEQSKTIEVNGFKLVRDKETPYKYDSARMVRYTTTYKSEPLIISLNFNMRAFNSLTITSRFTAIDATWKALLTADHITRKEIRRDIARCIEKSIESLDDHLESTNIAQARAQLEDHVLKSIDDLPDSIKASKTFYDDVLSNKSIRCYRERGYGPDKGVVISFMRDGSVRAAVNLAVIAVFEDEDALKFPMSNASFLRSMNHVGARIEQRLAHEMRRDTRRIEARVAAENSQLANLNYLNDQVTMKAGRHVLRFKSSTTRRDWCDWIRFEVPELEDLGCSVEFASKSSDRSAGIHVTCYMSGTTGLRNRFVVDDPFDLRDVLTKVGHNIDACIDHVKKSALPVEARVASEHVKFMIEDLFDGLNVNGKLYKVTSSSAHSHVRQIGLEHKGGRSIDSLLFTFVLNDEETDIGTYSISYRYGSGVTKTFFYKGSEFVKKNVIEQCKLAIKELMPSSIEARVSRESDDIADTDNFPDSIKLDNNVILTKHAIDRGIVVCQYSGIVDPVLNLKLVVSFSCSTEDSINIRVLSSNALSQKLYGWTIHGSFKIPTKLKDLIALVQEASRDHLIDRSKKFKSNRMFGRI